MTRLLVKLRATERSTFDREYHKDLQGLVYSLLRGSSDYNVHDKPGYKFFSFSEVFPFGDLRKGDIRNWVIASPNAGFIFYLKEQLEYLQNVRIGAMQFKVESCNFVEVRLAKDRPVSLITGSPIATRIPMYRFEEANALNLVNGYGSSYWRCTHPVELFINQLEANLRKKYSAYTGTKAAKDDQETEPIFYSSRFLKQVAIEVPITSDYRQTVIGSKWLFRFAAGSNLVRFALDVGLGEHNSLGFGFMNVQSSTGGMNNN